MAIFIYNATSKDGKTETGTIEAANSVAAGHLLKEQGLMPLDLHEKRGNHWLEVLQQYGTIPLKQKIVFIEDLQLLLKSGVAAPRALRILAKQTSNKRFQSVLSSIGNDVEAGKSLHESMAAFPKVFSHIFVSMVQVGELSGNLEKSLEYLAIQLEREAELKSRTKGAMIYPAVIVSAMVIIGILMAIFVLPKLTATFKEFNTALPLSTRIVVAITDFMAARPVTILGGLVLLIAGSIAFFRTPVGMRTLDWVLLHFPLINPIVKKINIARFARILSSLMKSGVAIIEGLKVTSDAMENSYYREVIDQTSENVKVGKPLTEALAVDPKLFPFIISQMLAIGEETGNLETILEQIAVHYEQEIDNTMKDLSSIIEPLLLLTIGGVVGVLAIALIGPIYNIGQSIG